MPTLPRSMSSLNCARAALCALCVALFGPSALAAGLTIGVTPSALSLPIDVAQAQGHFAAEGVDVRVVDFGSGPACMKRLFEGGVTLCTVSELPVVTASFQRTDFTVLATIATASGNIRVVGRKSAGVTRPQDLIGKRIGAMAGTSSHYYLDAYLLFHGIDPQQVKFVPLAAEAVVGSLEQGRIDAFSGYSRHTGVAMKSLGADLVMLDDPRIYSETYNLVAGKSNVAARRLEIVKVLRAVERAERFIAENPGRAKEILAGRATIDRALIDRIFPAFTYRLSLDQSLIGAMEGEARWALREGHVDAGSTLPNYLKFVDDGPLRAAVPAALPK